MSETGASALRPIEIVPSILPADFARLGEECASLEAAGVDRIQFDVMDGVFVPNLTFGPDVVAACRPHAGVPFEAHLMVADPDPLLGAFADAGCEMLIIHAESVTHLHRTLNRVAEAGAAAAVAVNPSTPVEAVAHVLDLIEMVLVMTVNPGFGGQAYIRAMEPKIAALRRLIDRSGATGASGSGIDIEVDGGISAATIGGTAAAGANVCVSGSALYRYAEGLRHGVDDLRSRAEAARSG